MAARGRGDLAALTGVLFVGLFVAGILAQGAGAGSAAYPMPTDGQAIVQAYFAAATTTGLVAGLHILSAFALFWFAVTLAGIVRRSGKPDAAAVVLAGGVIATVFQSISGVVMILLGNVEIVADAGLTQALVQISFWAGGPLNVAGFGAMVAGTGFALLGVALPRWLDVFGIVIGSVASLALLSVVVWPLVAATPIGRYVGFVWVLITSVMLALRQRVDVPVPARQ
jgi:hypothetical protein